MKFSRTKNIWDKFTDNYSYFILHPQYFYKKYDHQAVQVYKKYIRGILLDIGAGRMPYKSELEPKVKKYISLDNPGTVDRYKVKDKPDILADATKIPLRSNFCDTVLLLEVLEHIPDPKKVLKEIYRVLKPGGILVMSTPMTYPLHDVPYDFYRFTSYGLENLFNETGFKVIHKETLGNAPILILQNFNLMLMFYLRDLISKKNKIVYLLAPFFLSLTTLSNLIALVFENVGTKNSPFKIANIFVVKKK